MGGINIKSITLERANYQFCELEKVQMHNQREICEESIVQSNRTALNYDVLNKKLINYENTIKRCLTQLSSTKSVRSNWTVLIEWRVIFEEYSLQKLSVRETKLFFLQVVQTFQKFYGISNIIYANVHFDEEKPHLHIGLIPMKEGRLNSAQIITKYKNSELEDELSIKFEMVLKQNKTSISGKNISRAHNTSKSNEEFLEYKELYNKLINHSIMPSEIGIKKPEIQRKDCYCNNKRIQNKNHTIEELKQENEYLEYLVKQLKAEKNYLLKVMKESEKNIEQLEKQLCINVEINERMYAKFEFENKKQIKKLAEI